MRRRDFLRTSSAGLGTLGAAPIAAWAATPPATPAEAGADNERWQAIRKAAFGGRPVLADTQGLIALEMPLRAADGAFVPVALRAKGAAAGSIRKWYLVVDRNPSPLGATLAFAPGATRVDVETRIRVEEYSHARAIAELDDGRLVMQTRFVKAAGGCSAPAGADLAAAKATMGQVNFRLGSTPVAGQPLSVQLTVSHPNISGLAIDQVSRLAPLPHYVRSVEVRYAGQSVLSADVDFTLSENPTLHFQFVPQADGELRADIVDSADRKTSGSLALLLAPKGDA